MSKSYDPLRECRTCRFSRGIPHPALDEILWCDVLKRECAHMCPAYEREPGTEGDDD
jgi:hypothetical protein